MRSEFFWEVMERSSCINHLRSYDHGPAHWARVWQNGRWLGGQTKGCDLLVVELFALFHDSMRENEFRDPEHGERGYRLAKKVVPENLLRSSQWTALAEACVLHDAGFTTRDPTVGVCWDADRLDLGRVGIQPDPQFLSTDAAVEQIKEERAQA